MSVSSAWSSLDEALRRHLNEPTEETRYGAYELGRQAVEKEAGVLDALEAVAQRLCIEVARPELGSDPGAVIAAASEFLAEYLAPFELLVTGMKQSLEELRRSHDQLRQQARELEQSNQDLEAARSEAEHANRAKSEFLSRMSHELRTPLNAILGFSQLLERDDRPAGQRESVGHIVKSGQRLLELINDVLDIARIESGQLRVSPEPVSATQIAIDTVDLMRPLADRRHIALETSWDPEMQELHVMADRQRLGQVLLNLVSNAIKYNVDGGAVTVSCALAGDEMVRLAVIDTGPGIAPEKVPLLFTPFERLGAEQTDIEGTGLGLALSKSLVDAMGGQMLVETMLGRGTEFSIELSVVAAPAPEDDAVAGHVPQSAIELAASGTLLYIEDNISNVQLIEAVLKLRPNVKLISSMTGSIGLALAREHNPDLILLDLQLPDESGDTVLRRMRKHTQTANVPIVIASADATPGQMDRLLAAGADDYLTKPIDVNLLLDVIDRLLGARR